MALCEICGCQVPMRSRLVLRGFPPLALDLLELGAVVIEAFSSWRVACLGQLEGTDYASSDNCGCQVSACSSLLLLPQ